MSSRHECERSQLPSSVGRDVDRSCIGSGIAFPNNVLVFGLLHGSCVAYSAPNAGGREMSRVDRLGKLAQRTADACFAQMQSLDERDTAAVLIHLAQTQVKAIYGDLPLPRLPELEPAATIALAEILRLLRSSELPQIQIIQVLSAVCKRAVASFD